MDDLFGLSEIPEPDQRLRILQDIWRRLSQMVSCSDQSGYLIRVFDNYIPIPSASPSEPENGRYEKFVGLKPEFSDLISYGADFEKVAELRSKDPNLPLIASADELFNTANSVGAEVMAYASELEAKLVAEFPAKDFRDSRDVPSKEYADFPELVHLIVEKQLGISRAAIINSNYSIGAMQLPALQVTHGAIYVWAGPEEMRLARRRFVDSLLLDMAKVDKLKEVLPKIKQRASELSGAIEGVIRRVKEAALLVEADAQRVAKRPKPGLSYNGPEGRLQAENGAANFNRGRARTILETLIIRREATLDELIGAIQSTLEPDGDPKRVVWAAIQHLNATFEEKGLVLKIENNDMAYKLSQAVAVDNELRIPAIVTGDSAAS